MGIRLKLGMWSAVFAVPTDIVDKHLKLCGEQELKFILWALRSSDRELSPKEAFSQGGITEDAFEDCVDYWVQAGLLSTDGESLLPAGQAKPAFIPESSPQAVAPAALAPAAPAAVSQPSSKMLRPDSIYISKRLKESPGLAQVFHDAEAILGKTISPSLSAILMNAHDDYSLPSEVILMLISYVASIGKTSTAYIEALVRNWSEGAVHSIEAAEQKIRDLDEKNRAWKQFVRATGIPYRDMAKKEEPYICRWLLQMKFSPDMLRLCYETCVMNTGKLSVKYMDTIFDNWYKQGLMSPESVERRDLERKGEVSSKSTYNINEFERLNVFDIKDNKQ